MEFRIRNGIVEKLVFAKRIRRKGRWIYPKTKKVFRFWVPIGKNQEH